MSENQSPTTRATERLATAMANDQVKRGSVALAPTTSPAPDNRSDQTRERVRARIVEELAKVRAIDPAEMGRDIAAGGGDAEIDSPEAEAVIGALESHFGCTLPGPADLRPKQFNSVDALVTLVERKLAKAPGSPSRSKTAA